MDNESPTKVQAKRYMNLYLSVVLVILSFGLGVWAGELWYVRKQAVNAQGQIDISKVINLNRTINHSDSVDFNQFWKIWDLVKQKYVKQPVKDTDLFYGAMQGMVAGLGDPYSEYFPPQAAQDFGQSLAGELSGIGAEVGIKNNQLVVVAPLPGSPAEQAGLRPGDKILAIDNRLTIGMDIDTAVQKIRGPAGTTTTLTIGRGGVSRPMPITITREQINVPSVMFSMKPGNIAYIRVLQFNESTMPEFTKYTNEIRRQSDVKGVILDLRNNPGGYLDSAIEMASEWIGSGTVVSEKFSDGKENVHTADCDGCVHSLVGLKTVVLVNGGSASASEIVSGALQDHQVATIVGEKTFGKGSVQDFQTLPDGSAIKITVAEWYTPNGHNINETGITPDVVVKEDFDKEKIGQDVMIDKAMELLRK